MKYAVKRGAALEGAAAGKAGGFAALRNALACAIAGLAGITAAGCTTLSMESLNPWSGPREYSRVPADAMRYACDGGRTLLVRPGPTPQSMMLMYPDREFRLDAEAGGSRFSNGRTNLTLAGDVATVEEAGAVVYGGCKRAAPAG